MTLNNVIFLCAIHFEHTFSLPYQIWFLLSFQTGHVPTLFSQLLKTIRILKCVCVEESESVPLWVICVVTNVDWYVDYCTGGFPRVRPIVFRLWVETGLPREKPPNSVWVSLWVCACLCIAMDWHRIQEVPYLVPRVPWAI